MTNRKRYSSKPKLTTKQAYVKALSHPLRARILDEKSGEDVTFSPSALAEEWDQKLANMAYHVRILLDLGLVKLVKKQQVRGAVQHTYAVDPEKLALARAEGVMEAKGLTPLEALAVVKVIEAVGANLVSTSLTKEENTAFRRAYKKLRA